MSPVTAREHSLLRFKPIPERATLDSRVSDRGRLCDSTHIEFKWRLGIHFERNAAKNNDLFKKCFEQKSF